jgi:hypothetical protein
MNESRTSVRWRDTPRVAVDIGAVLAGLDDAVAPADEEDV